MSSSPLQVLDVVFGVYEGIRASDWVESTQIPVHAFGVSSRMMPYLAAMGVDTFDGSTYVQQAQQLRYSRRDSFSINPFLALDDLPCTCRYCKVLNKGGLDEAKRLLTNNSYGKIEFGGRETTKSYFYGLIALHNLQTSLELAEQIR